MWPKKCLTELSHHRRIAGLLGTCVTPWSVGLCLAAAAAPWWVVARRQLGAAFSVGPPACQRVTRGLSATLRHPVYVCGSLAWRGAHLARRLRAALISWLVVVAIAGGRARRAERGLAEAFAPRTRRTDTGHGSSTPAAAVCRRRNVARGQRDGPSDPCACDHP
jgi:hypothetical protein